MLQVTYVPLNRIKGMVPSRPSTDIFILDGHGFSNGHSLKIVVHLKDAPRHRHQSEKSRQNGQRNGPPNRCGQQGEQRKHTVGGGNKHGRCMRQAPFRYVFDRQFHLIGHFAVFVEILNRGDNGQIRCDDSVQ